MDENTEMIKDEPLSLLLDHDYDHKTNYWGEIDERMGE